MKSKKIRFLLIPVYILTAVILTHQNNAQEADAIDISLKLDYQHKQPFGPGIMLEKSKAENVLIGKAPGGLLVSVERLPEPKSARRFRIDTDADGNLENEPYHDLLPDSSITIELKRKWPNGRQQILPYSINTHIYRDKDNEVQESLSWFPHYRAEGKLKIKNCQTLLVVLDANGDGLFDEHDFTKATSIGLDKNGDGKIWGAEEWLKGNQIVDYCGASLLIENLKIDGSTISFAETNLRVPKIGDPLPAFSIATDDGKSIESAKLRDKIFLLDFWASWCSPCVGKFVDVKQLDKEFGDDLKIIAINVDNQSETQVARQIIKKFELKWPQVISGRGEEDPLWKMFGSMANNRLSIPLYVLVDHQGVLRYAGDGSDNFRELHANIQKLIQLKNQSAN